MTSGFTNSGKKEKVSGMSQETLGAIVLTFIAAGMFISGCVTGLAIAASRVVEITEEII